MKIVTGKKYYVSDTSEEHAIDCQVAKIALATDSNGVHLFEGFTGIEPWLFATPIPEVGPYTQKTFPTNRPVWIIRNGHTSKQLVTVIKENSIETEKSHITYEELADSYKEANGNLLEFS